MGRQAAAMFSEDLPEIVARSLCYAALDGDELLEQVETVEDSRWLRGELMARGLVTFLPDGAVLTITYALSLPEDGPNAMPSKMKR